MNYEKIDLEKIDEYIIESELIEHQLKIGNILKKKNVPIDRSSSIQGYQIVNYEVGRVIKYFKHSVSSTCSKYKESYVKKKCKQAMALNAIEQIKKLSNECEKCKYHKKRCLRKIQTVLKYFYSQIEQ